MQVENAGLVKEDVMMKNFVIVLFLVGVIGGCEKPAAEMSDVERKQFLADIERIETPVEVVSSGLLGLSEREVAEKYGLTSLNPERGHANKKWFYSGFTHFPRGYGDSYVWKRCNVLTFANGKVVKHEEVDRIAAHVSFGGYPQ